MNIETPFSVPSEHDTGLSYWVASWRHREGCPSMNDDVPPKITLESFSSMAHKVSIADFDAFTEAAGRSWDAHVENRR
ncbi:hypothetical protein NMB32_19755 [Stenotrophomonas sp. CD2]|nr:hypothetical protein NMB32_19755 [Stenotrophomonas sp. CD2]